MQLSSLDRLLDRSPVVVQRMNPVSLAYLREPLTVYHSLEPLVCMLDDAAPCQPGRIVALDADHRYVARFPVVTVEHDPFTPDLNRVLFQHYDSIAASMLTQAQVADRIVKESDQVPTVVLVLLDGMSYADCRDWPDVEPCLASAPTVTRVGFPSVVGDPPLAARLFAKGLRRRVGFTYWERSADPLTDRLFRTISEVRRLDPSQADSFGQVIDWLDAHDLGGTYIQVVYSALDEYAEGHRTMAPRGVIVQRVLRDLEAMADVLRHKNRRALLFAVADHGLLWKDGGHSFERIDMGSARYIEGRGGPGRGRCLEAEERSYWVLDYPQIGRAWRSNEQAVHGGVSFEESIVPFLRWEVGALC